VIDADVMQDRIRNANPIPHVENLNADELAYFVAATRTRRAAAMQAPTQYPTETETTPATAPLPRRRSVWAFAAAFVLILGVIGAAGLLLRGDGTPVADEPAVSVDSPEPATFVPDLETLTWTRVGFSTEELREHYSGVLVFDPDHGFRLWHSQGLWESDDGMSWTFVDVPTEFADYTVANLVDHSANTVGFGFGSSDSGSYVLLSWQDDTWVEVGQLEMPDTVGMIWTLEELDAPIESGGVLLARGRLRGGLPWGEIYGRFTRPACRECEEWPPRARWDKSSQTLRIVHPFDDSVLASLRIEVAGDTATFRDAETGDAVHEVVGSAVYPIGWLVDNVFTHGAQWRYNITSEQIWAGMPGTDFEFHEAPPGEILAVPDGSGFVSYELEFDPAPAGSPRWGLVTGVRAWTSTDATTWSEATAPPFPQPQAHWVDINSGVGEIYASVDMSVPVDEGRDAEFWVSSDGVAWTQKVLPADYQNHQYVSGPYPTEFGYVAWSREDDPRYWMSLDGESWIEVAGPAGSHGWSAVAGSTLFWANGTDDGDVLWVGRFKPES